MPLTMSSPFRGLLGALLLAISAMAHAGGGGTVMGNGGATEITQVLNNAELLKQVSLQSAQVAESVRQTITQAAQYATMIQNLKQLPVAAIGMVLAPYKDQLRDLKVIYDSVRSLQRSSEAAGQVLNGTLQSAASLKMTPKQYVEWLKNESQNRQSFYAKKLDQELKVLDDMPRRYEALQSAQKAIPGIDAQVSGLQQLNVMTGMAVGELMDMRTAIQATKAEETSRRGMEEAARQKGVDLMDAEYRARMDYWKSMEGYFDRMINK